MTWYRISRQPPYLNPTSHFREQTNTLYNPSPKPIIQFSGLTSCLKSHLLCMVTSCGKVGLSKTTYWTPQHQRSRQWHFWMQNYRVQFPKNHTYSADHHYHFIPCALWTPLFTLSACCAMPVCCTKGRRERGTSNASCFRLPVSSNHYTVHCRDHLDALVLPPYVTHAWQ